MLKTYLAYMLRIWQTGERGSAAWHASLENPHTRQVQQFASLDLLIEYLQSIPNPPASNHPPLPPNPDKETSV